METDEASRVRQSACLTTSPDIMRALATDPSVTVRVSLALNPALPEHVSAMLAADTDARVRTILSRKLATLTPTLGTDARQRVQRDAVASLTAMVADAALRVRANIAEAVKGLADGPRDIILRLAHDPAVMVCGPVIRFSPMLTQEDLVTLITSGPPPSTVVAVAQRPKIGPTVSDAIVTHGNSEAIEALLANRTAQIREATLDALAAQSEEHTGWQEPLVHRPHLPAMAQRMLSEIVTGHLLETLAARRDLDPKVSQALRLTLMNVPPSRRALVQMQPGLAIVEPASPGVPGKAEAPGTAMTKPDSADSQAAHARAQALQEAGKLDDYTVLDALRRNATMEACTMVAVRAGVAVSVVERVCDLRSAKAIVSLAWKGGMSPQTAVVLQSMLVRLSPDLVLRPNPAGEFGLSEEEMRWQLNFLGVGESEPRSWAPRRLS